jgi:hypothetical protein
MSSPPAAEPFFASELKRALDEQSFGIKSSTLLSSSLFSAEASVTLLEGRTIVIVLTSQGYSVSCSCIVMCHQQVLKSALCYSGQKFESCEQSIVD